jgi:hypothetical protein
MTIQQVTVDTAGQIGVNPRIVKVVCDNTLTEVTTAGFLNNNSLPQPLKPTDMVLAYYATDSGFDTSFFNVAISTSGVITLSVNTDIPDGSITTAKLAAQAVTFEKLAPGSVLTSILGANVVDANRIDANAVTTVKIQDAAVTLAKLASGITPSHVVKFAGKHTTTGGSATEAFTVTGVVAATDIVIASMTTATGTPRTLLTTALTDNTITCVFSGDPSTTHVVSYQVLRAVA